MALSLSISASQLSQSVADNRTNLRVNVNISWTSGSYDHYGSTKYVTVNGSTYYFSSEKINPNRTTSGSQTLYSIDVSIPHNSDGTKTVSICFRQDSNIVGNRYCLKVFDIIDYTAGHIAICIVVICTDGIGGYDKYAASFKCVYAHADI